MEEGRGLPARELRPRGPVAHHDHVAGTPAPQVLEELRPQPGGEGVGTRRRVEDGEAGAGAAPGVEVDLRLGAEDQQAVLRARALGQVRRDRRRGVEGRRAAEQSFALGRREPEGRAQVRGRQQPRKQQRRPCDRPPAKPAPRRAQPGDQGPRPRAAAQGQRHQQRLVVVHEDATRPECGRQQGQAEQPQAAGGRALAPPAEPGETADAEQPQAEVDPGHLPGSAPQQGEGAGHAVGPGSHVGPVVTPRAGQELRARAAKPEGERHGRHRQREPRRHPQPVADGPRGAGPAPAPGPLEPQPEQQGEAALLGQGGQPRGGSGTPGRRGGAPTGAQPDGQRDPRQHQRLRAGRMRDAILVEGHQHEGETREAGGPRARETTRRRDHARRGEGAPDRRRQSQCDQALAREPLDRRHPVERQRRLLVVDVPVRNGTAQDLPAQVRQLPLVTHQGEIEERKPQRDRGQQQAREHQRLAGELPRDPGTRTHRPHSTRARAEREGRP